MLDKIAPDQAEYLTSHQLIGIQADSIRLKNMISGDLSTRSVDAVVLSVGYKADQQPLDSFSGTAPVVLTNGTIASR